MGRWCLLLLFVGASACGRTRYDLSRTQPVEIPQLLAAGGEWIKDKGRKFDVRWWIQNRSNYELVIYRDDFKCARGTTPGKLRGMERSPRVQLGPGQERVFTLTCETIGTRTGSFEMTMAQVFESRQPEDDRLVAKDMVWIIETD